jgi:hypothetical protein
MNRFGRALITLSVPSAAPVRGFCRPRAVPSFHCHRAFCSGSVAGVTTTTTPVTAASSGSSSATAAEVIPGSKRDVPKYVMMYTCSVCDTRSAKQITKQSYHEGTVLIRCPGCQSLHLICDHIGIMGDKGWNIEDYLKEHQNQAIGRPSGDAGEQIIELNSNDASGTKSNFKFVTNDNVLELTLDDVLGKDKTFKPE